MGARGSRVKGGDGGRQRRREGKAEDEGAHDVCAIGELPYVPPGQRPDAEHEGRGEGRSGHLGQLGRRAGQPLRLVVWRNRHEVVLNATSRRIVRLDNQRNRYGIAPRYLVYAGLVFMPLDRELMKTVGRGAGGADRNLVWHQLYREAEQPETVNREVVVLTRVLRHPVNSQMTFPGPVAVSRINGVVLQGLADVPRALAAGGGRFLTFEYEGGAGSRPWTARRPRPRRPRS